MNNEPSNIIKYFINSFLLHSILWFTYFLLLFQLFPIMYSLFRNDIVFLSDYFLGISSLD